MAFYLDPAAINRGTSMYEHAIASNRQEDIDRRERIRFEDEQQRNQLLDGAMQKMAKLNQSPLAEDDGKEVSYLQRFNNPNGIGFSVQNRPTPADGQGGGSVAAQSPVQANPVAEPQSNPATNNILTPPVESQPSPQDVVGAGDAPKPHPAIAPIQQRFERQRAGLQAALQAAIAKRDVGTAHALNGQLEALNSDFAAAKMVGVTMHELQNNPQMGTELAKRLTENNNYGELAADFDPKYGVTTLKIKDTGREVRLAPHQMGLMVAAMHDMENGNYERGYKTLTSIDKDVAERIQRGNELQKSVVANNNDAVAKNEAIRHARAVDGRAATDQNLRQQEFDAKKPVNDLAALDASIRIEMAKLPPDDPRRQELQDRLNAMGGVKNSSPELKHAQELVRLGVVPDLKSGYEMALTRKSKSARDFYTELLTSKGEGGLGRTPEEVDKIMLNVYGDGWMKQVRGGTASAPGAAPAPASGGKPTGGALKNVTPQDIANTAKRHGVSEDEVKRRLGM